MVIAGIGATLQVVSNKATAASLEAFASSPSCSGLQNWGGEGRSETAGCCAKASAWYILLYSTAIATVKAYLLCDTDPDILASRPTELNWVCK